MQHQTVISYRFCLRRDHNIAPAVCDKIWDQTKCGKCTQREGNEMSKQKEVAFAKSQGLQRIGTFEIDVKEDLKDEEKLSVGKAHCDLVVEIESLQLEKKEFDDGIKGKIKDKAAEARDMAKLIHNGYRIERRSYPCFLDSKKKERVYVDLDTGEEIKREPMHEEDRQMNL